MSGSKLGNAADFQPIIVESRRIRLDLAASAIQIRKNGIEFRSATPFNVWAEMTVSLQTPLDPRRLNCTGVVVECHGNRHAGYRVSMVFTDLSPQTQARLSALAYSR
jgi:hypothetical protein